MMDVSELERKLNFLLNSFSIPKERIGDYYWLNKNIHTLNSNHRDLSEVKRLIVEILNAKNKQRIDTFVKK